MMTFRQRLASPLNALGSWISPAAPVRAANPSATGGLAALPLVNPPAVAFSEVFRQPVPLRAHAYAYAKHCLENAVPEAACILACEFGETIGEGAAFLAGIPNYNGIGLATGIIAGFSYAVYHVWRDAARAGLAPTFRQVATFCLSTESGCVVSASAAEYLVGRFLVMGANPFALASLGIRAATLPMAFGLGLGVMSAFTYAGSSEVARFSGKSGGAAAIAEKGAVELRRQGWEVAGDATSVMLSIGGNVLRIHEIPGGGGGSEYVVKSSFARLGDQQRDRVEDFAHQILKDAVGDVAAVAGLSHDHGHHDHEHEHV